MPSHGHTLNNATNQMRQGGGATGGSGGSDSYVAITADNAGGGQSHENRPPYLAHLYCEKD